MVRLAMVLAGAVGAALLVGKQVGLGCYRGGGESTAAMPATKPAEADLLSGQWVGAWSSTTNKMGGRLRCTATRIEQRKYRAVFQAVFGKVFLHNSTVLLEVEAVEEGRWRFRGQEDLGLLSGGVYQYAGHSDGREFYSTYDSKFDKGIFRMNWVGPASQPDRD